MPLGIIISACTTINNFEVSTETARLFVVQCQNKPSFSFSLGGGGYEAEKARLPTNIYNQAVGSTKCKFALLVQNAFNSFPVSITSKCKLAL